MKRDLGTYYLRVELLDGRGWIQEWFTGGRYTMGSRENSPLHAQRIEPGWENEQEVLESMLYMYLDGNFSCDCNKVLFLARAQQLPEPEHTSCGDTMELERLTAIRPDGSEVELWNHMAGVVRKGDGDGGR